MPDDMQEAADHLSQFMSAYLENVEVTTAAVDNLITSAGIGVTCTATWPGLDLTEVSVSTVSGPTTIEWWFSQATGRWTTIVNGAVHTEELPSPYTWGSVTATNVDAEHLVPLTQAEIDDGGKSFAFGGCTCEHLDWEHHRNGCEVDECPCTGGWLC